ncbi:MAG TPA: hypothetical protein VGR02_20700 [Thermoanaerobaculia bacterium]|jgi:hypothetical protein|nr:hypothetical protein [Thermoanaerobaculia bacterium]
MIWMRGEITNEALIDMVSTLQGYWKDEGGREAVIERGDARVFVSASSDLSDAYQEDVQLAAEQLQQVPKGVVWINVGHGSGSDVLAQKVATMILNRWAGVLDRDEK